MTRSGRIYSPQESRKDEVVGQKENKGKEKEEVVLKEKVEEKGKKVVSDEEAGEFLKFIQQSEYRVIDQLNRMPARISLLGLLMNSETHRKLLMRILSEAHVAHDISLDKFGGIVGNITANNYLTFTDDEVPTEGRGHNKALHISVKCSDYIVARVLVDNGSSLNVMPKSTMEKLPFDMTYMKPSSMVVRAFDGSRREVMGEIELPIQIGPCVFQISFQVMDIVPAYSCLLGRPWIHSAGVVPSTLHQKLKFVVDDKLIIVSGEEDLLVSKPSTTRYIEAAEEALETSFQSLEIVSTAYVETPPKEPKFSSATLMMARTMISGGYQPGQGLGKGQGGIARPIELPEKKDRCGLGYKATKADKKKIAAEKKERRLARLENREPRTERIPICNLYQSFRSAGLVSGDQVAMAKEDQVVDEDISLVYSCASHEELCNWESIELPVICKSVLK